MGRPLLRLPERLWIKAVRHDQACRHKWHANLARFMRLVPEARLVVGALPAKVGGDSPDEGYDGLVTAGGMDLLPWADREDPDLWLVVGSPVGVEPALPRCFTVRPVIFPGRGDEVEIESPWGRIRLRCAGRSDEARIHGEWVCYAPPLYPFIRHNLQRS